MNRSKTSGPVSAGPVSGRSDDLAAWMEARGARAEQALECRLPAPTGTRDGRDQLLEAMRYAVLGGGKRVRPLLVYAAGEVSGAPDQVLDACACAVELIHAYSLVHDDMPCMDNDELRRGKPTVHRKYGEAVAMLVGDALQALAFEVLVAPLRSPLLSPAGTVPQAAAASGAASAAAVLPVAEMVSVLAGAAGADGMAGGQALDIAAVGERLDLPRLESMHRLKTGAMLAASVRLGFLAGGRWDPTTASAVEAYSAAVGLAFQVVDDILDVTADSATLGKTAGKDLAQDKPTYVSILGLAESQALAGQLALRAREALEPFGAQASRLARLAEFIVDRVH